MTLEDFEKSLEAETKGKDEKHRYRREKSDHSSDSRRAKHGHRHRHTGRERTSGDDIEGHPHKRARRSKEDEDDYERRHRPKHRRRHHDPEEDAEAAGEETAASTKPESLQRDSWMEAPSAIDIDYVQRPQKPPPPPAKQLQADFELKIHEKELNHHLHDILADTRAGDDTMTEPVQHAVDYTFGDSGSRWRMTKLKAVYRQAKETGQPVEEIATQRFGDVRSFDDAREEEIEISRRETYGEGYIGKNKPSGELFQERKLEAGIHRPAQVAPGSHVDGPVQGAVVPTQTPQNVTQAVDQTALNRLKAQMMKSKLRKAPDAEKLETEYNLALATFSNTKQPDVVVLGAMENPMLASGPRNEVKAVENRRGRERGQVESNEDMSIEDMVREERRTRNTGGGESQRFAERIAKDDKFTNDLDYMDENASKLAKRVEKSEINIRNTAIGDFQKMSRILDACPLCHHEDTGTPPVAPVVSLATRVYLTLPTEPELNEGGACIVPVQHRTNLLECDDDEWEELRNFMKCLTRMYHDQGRDVIFYENAASPHRRPHAAMFAIPLPYSLGETAPAFFKEAILTADEEWTQHKKLIDTLAKSKQGLGKLAFRRTLAKEMPYFHVWFEMDGGLGHIIEDANRWPKGDLFAREIIGGMLDLGPDVIKKQGRWNRGDRRVDGFRRKWKKFDWTRVLSEE